LAAGLAAGLLAADNWANQETRHDRANAAGRSDRGGNPERNFKKVLATYGGEAIHFLVLACLVFLSRFGGLMVMVSSGVELDFIEELRLRRWAREHYVPRQQRQMSWHPIVLEEMSLRDDEVSDVETVLTCA
jgi:hypothetical protein